MANPLYKDKHIFHGLTHYPIMVLRVTQPERQQPKGAKDEVKLFEGLAVEVGP